MALDRDPGERGRPAGPRRGATALAVSLVASFVTGLGVALAAPANTSASRADSAGVPAVEAPTPPAGTPVAVRAPMDTSSLAHGPGSRMSALLEKTFLNVDVLRLELRFSPETQAELLPLVRGRSPSPALADSVAAVALRSRDAWAQIRFLRHVSLGRFVGGVNESLRSALKAGIITEANYRTVSEGLPRWFGFLSESGFARGDRILYRITPAGLRTVFVDAGGRTRLDQTDAGRDPPLALLAGYFAPGSDFRPLLIRSLLEGS